MSKVRDLVRIVVSPVPVLLVLLSTPTAADAQTASFRAVDTDSNGVLSVDELVARFGPDGAARLLDRSDRDGDRSLTIPELRYEAGNGRSGGTGRDDRGDRGDDDRDERGDRDRDDRDRDDDRGDSDGSDGGDGGGGDGGDGDGGGGDGGDDDD